jgi:hypothetical protein
MTYQASISNTPSGADVPTNQPDTNTTSGTTQTDTISSAPVSPTAAPAAPAEPQYVQDLRTAFTLALATPDFIGDKKKVEKATAALTLPKPETRVWAQDLTNARRKLNDKAVEEAKSTGNPLVFPTEQQIINHAIDSFKLWWSKNGKGVMPSLPLKP